MAHPRVRSTLETLKKAPVLVATVVSLVAIGAWFRGEGIENPIEDLARQGLIPACRKLGIIQ